MAKADNMLSILWLLNTREKITAKKIAEELEINIRTVYRYIDALCASGVPIISDAGHNGGYSLSDNFTEAPLFFDMDEQKALLHASVFAKEAQYPFSSALERATSKLKRYTNSEQLNELNRHLIGFDVISPSNNPSLEDSLKELEIAIANCLTVSIEYKRGYEEAAQTRSIDPYSIIYWNNKWYVIAYCQLRREIRSFRVDRIIRLSHTDLTFQRPSEFSARQFFMKSILPKLENKKELIEVVIQGTQQAINDICEHWLFGHLMLERSTDQVHLLVDKKSIGCYMPYYLISYGKSIKVIEPTLLKESMLDILKDLMEYYKL